MSEPPSSNGPLNNNQIITDLLEKSEKFKNIIITDIQNRIHKYNPTKKKISCKLKNDKNKCSKELQYIFIDLYETRESLQNAINQISSISKDTDISSYNDTIKTAIDKEKELIDAIEGRINILRRLIPQENLPQENLSTDKYLLQYIYTRIIYNTENYQSTLSDDDYKIHFSNLEKLFEFVISQYTNYLNPPPENKNNNKNKIHRDNTTDYFTRVIINLYERTIRRFSEFYKIIEDQQTKYRKDFIHRNKEKLANNIYIYLTYVNKIIKLLLNSLQYLPENEVDNILSKIRELDEKYRNLYNFISEFNDKFLEKSKMDLKELENLNKIKNQMQTKILQNIKFKKEDAERYKMVTVEGNEVVEGNVKLDKKNIFVPITVATFNMDVKIVPSFPNSDTKETLSTFIKTQSENNISCVIGLQNLKGINNGLCPADIKNILDNININKTINKITNKTTDVKYIQICDTTKNTGLSIIYDLNVFGDVVTPDEKDKDETNFELKQFEIYDTTVGPILFVYTDNGYIFIDIHIDIQVTENAESVKKTIEETIVQYIDKNFGGDKYETGRDELDPKKVFIMGDFSKVDIKDIQIGDEKYIYNGSLPNSNKKVFGLVPTSDMQLFTDDTEPNTHDLVYATFDRPISKIETYGGKSKRRKTTKKSNRKITRKIRKQNKKQSKTKHRKRHRKTRK